MDDGESREPVILSISDYQPSVWPHEIQQYLAKKQAAVTGQLHQQTPATPQPPDHVTAMKLAVERMRIATLEAWLKTPLPKTPGDGIPFGD